MLFALYPTSKSSGLTVNVALRYVLIAVAQFQMNGSVLKSSDSNQGASPVSFHRLGYLSRCRNHQPYARAADLTDIEKRGCLIGCWIPEGLPNPTKV